MNEVTAGIGWGLAGGLAVTVVLLVIVLVALWQRTKGPDGAQPQDTGEVHPFAGFGAKRA